MTSLGMLRDDTGLLSNRSAMTHGKSSYLYSDEEEEEEEEVEESPILGMTTDNDAELRVGGATPASEDVAELLNKPDITIFCEPCSCFIDLGTLPSHRYYHKALDIMRYHGDHRPESVRGLLKRRRAILRKLKKNNTAEDPLNQHDLQKVNDAYEFLKADLEDTYQALRNVTENSVIDVRGLALNCSALCVLAVGFASDGNERWKSQMEDARVFQDCFGSDPNKCYFGVFDGHHGRFAAEVAANELHHALLIEMEKFDPKTKCTCTFNMADSYDISHYDLHSRPNTTKTIRGEIHEYSTNVVHQIIASCEDIVSELQNEDSGRSYEAASRASMKRGRKDMDPFSLKMCDAFCRAHKHTDAVLAWGRDEMSRVRWSGTSTLACVVQNKMTNKIENKEDGEDDQGEMEKEEREEAEKRDTQLEELGVIHIANTGNSHAVLVRGNRAYRITKDHTPYNKKEEKRVLREGGSVSESEKLLRVNGVIATTRGLGNHGDPLMKKCVVSEPYTTAVKIDQYAQMLIMASNGVWEVLSPEEATSLLLQMLPSNHVPAPSRISSCIHRLLLTPAPMTTSPSDINSVDSDYLAANRKLLPDPYMRINDELGIERDPLEGISMADNYSIEESGNEADIDTSYTDHMSRILGGLPTREEIQREYARLISERLVQAALLAGSRSNITVEVILFPGSGL